MKEPNINVSIYLKVKRKANDVYTMEGSYRSLTEFEMTVWNMRLIKVFIIFFRDDNGYTWTSFVLSISESKNNYSNLIPNKYGFLIPKHKIFLIFELYWNLTRIRSGLKILNPFELVWIGIHFIWVKWPSLNVRVVNRYNWIRF
jgi:hypothetical protein